MVYSRYFSRRLVELGFVVKLMGALKFIGNLRANFILAIFAEIRERGAYFMQNRANVICGTIRERQF